MSEEEKPVILEEDARSMVRLLADVATIEGGQEEKKRRLMSGLCSLVAGRYWLWGLAADFVPGTPPTYTAILSGGFSGEQFPKLLVALDNRELEKMAAPLGYEIARTGKQTTRTPHEYDPNNVFGAEENYQAWKEADVSLPLVCYRPVANNSLSSIGIYRPFDSPPFSKRDSRIVDIIMSEVDWLHELGWPWESALKAPKLPNRCRVALNLLLEGLPRKRVATRMDISVHTLNEYIKHIYSFYSVHSQAELVNRFRIGDAQ